MKTKEQIVGTIMGAVPTCGRTEEYTELQLTIREALDELEASVRRDERLRITYNAVVGKIGYETVLAMYHDSKEEGEWWAQAMKAHADTLNPPTP